MPKNENETLARRYMQAWSAGGAKLIDQLADPNIRVFYSHFPAPFQGAEQVKAMLRQTHTSFPDLRLTVDELLCDGDRVAVQWHYQGTHREGEIFGMAPTGKAVRVSGFTLLRIENGKVVEESGVVDNFSLQQQLQ